MSLVYLDEELPEIELREIITGDEYLEDMKTLTDKKKGINIYTHEELYNQLLLLLHALQGDSSLPLKRKAEGFLQIHRDIIEESPFQLPRNILPELYLQRKDNGDEDTFFEEYDEAMKIEDYNIRRKELHRIFLGFETTNEEEPRLDLSTPAQVKIHGFPDMAVVLPKDQLLAKIGKIHESKGISPFHPSFKQLTMNDKITRRTGEDNHEEGQGWSWEMEKDATLQESCLREAKTRVDGFIENISSIGSLYDLWKEFMEIGIAVDTDLSKEQLKKLEEQLQILREKDKEVFEFVRATSKGYRPKKIDLQESHGGIAFYVIQKMIFDKLQPILEKLQEDLMNLYQTYLDSYPIEMAENTHIPNTAYDIAIMLYEEKATLPEVLDALRIRLLREQRGNIEKWLRMIRGWDIEGLEEKVSKEYQSFMRTQTSFYDEPLQPWVLQEEIKEIKKGEVLGQEWGRREEGGAGGTMDAMFYPTEEFVVESGDPDEIDIPEYEDDLPVSLETLDEGTRELMEISLRLFVSLQRASGLPLEYEKLLSAVEQYPSLRKTRKTQLEELLPEIPQGLREVLEKMDIQHVEQTLEQMTDMINIPKIKSSVLQVYKEFSNSLEQQLLYMLGWWICELQNHVLNRTLQFEIWKGALSCIQSWSPYGFPMEDVKKKEGILYYLMCVIYDLVHTEGTLWKQYVLQMELDNEKLVDTLQTRFTQEVKALQERAKVFEKELPTKGLLQKGEQIRKKIEETVEQRQKGKYLGEYMRFLKNLPSVLVQSSIAKKMHVGCCLQMLSERYRSDYDWSGFVKDAYKLKKLFATQRIGFDKRPLLSRIEREPAVVLPSPIQSNERYRVVVEVPAWSLETEGWLDTLRAVVPPKDYSVLSTNVSMILPVAEKNTDIYLRSVRQSNLRTFLFETADTQLLGEFYRKIMETQKKVMEITFGEKEREIEFLRAELERTYPVFEMAVGSPYFVNEYNDILRRRVLQYLISRQLCFPAKPELARNNALVMIENNLEASVLPMMTQKVHDILQEWIVGKTFQSSINFNDYLSKMREQENITKLQVVDVMNPEERKLYIQAKKLGIQELGEYLEMYHERMKEEMQNREARDVFEEEGENEFYPTIGMNDDETDMDNLYDDEPMNNYQY